MELKERINGIIAGTGRPMSAEDIYKSMTDTGGEIQIEEIKLALKELSRDGRVIITRRGKAALPEQLGLIYGRIQGNGRGFGFFIPADGSGDLFIAAEDMNGALHGDTVWVRRLSGSFRGRNDRGAVEMIAERAGRRVTGTFEEGGEYGGYVIPDNSRVAEDVLIPFSHTNGANHGDKVVAEITQYPGARRPMLGKIAEVLGRPGDKGIDMLSIIRRLELPDKFPDGAQRQAHGQTDTLLDDGALQEDVLAQLAFLTGDDGVGDLAHQVVGLLALDIGVSHAGDLGKHLTADLDDRSIDSSETHSNLSLLRNSQKTEPSALCAEHKNGTIRARMVPCWLLTARRTR